MITTRLKKTFFAIVASITLGLMSTSCNNENNVGVSIPDNLCADFVTFVSTNDDGSVFTFQKSGDSELITLTAPVKVDVNQIKPDTRVIIQYLPSGGQQPYQSGPIDLYGITRIVNGGVDKEELSTITTWGYNTLNMMTIGRSGKYLDVWAEAAFGGNPKRFVLAADEATLEDEYPQLYLVFVADDEFARIRPLYASFDLSSVWDLSTSKGVKINYNTASGTETLTLHKSGREPILPTE